MVVNPGEGFVVLFCDHLIVGGVEMGWECDEEDHDPKGDGYEDVDVFYSFFQSAESFALLQIGECSSDFR